MKICIIGPSGSGKTYLAKRLSEIHEIPVVNLDEILFVRIADKKRISRPKEEYLKELHNVFEKDSWIIEGIHPVTEVFSQSEKIVWLKPPCRVSLYQQWLRYFKDKRQREYFGLVNNVKLSIYIIKQYYGKPTPESDPKKTWVKSLATELIKHEDKVIVLKNKREKEEFIKRFEKLALTI